jgi:hypothetical protein
MDYNKNKNVDIQFGAHDRVSGIIFISIKKTAWNEYKKEGQTKTKEKGQKITQKNLKIEQHEQH